MFSHRLCGRGHSRHQSRQPHHWRWQTRPRDQGSDEAVSSAHTGVGPVNDDANSPPSINPYLAPAPLENKPSGPADSPFIPSEAKRKPRIWTVFAAVVAAFVGTIVLSVVGAVVVVIWYFA